MVKKETIYSQMSDGEKQTFDLMMDYGFIGEAKQMIRNKEEGIETVDRGHKTSD